MDWNYLPYIFPLAILIIFWVFLAWYAWQRYFVRGSPTFIIFMAQMVIWSAGTVIVLSTRNPQDKILGLQIMFAGSIGAPSSLMFFFSQFSQQTWLIKKRYQALFLFEPFILLLFIFTNQYHHLFLSENYLWEQAGGLLHVELLFGPVYWFHFAYSIAIYIYCIWILRRDFQLSSDLRRRQIGVLLAALAVLCVGSLFFGLLLRVTRLDMSLLVYIFAALVFAWGMLRFHLLDLMPVSQRTILERLEDGILVMDQHFRIADANTAMQKITAQSVSTLIGRSLEEVLPGLYQKVISANEDNRTRVDYVSGSGKDRNYYELHLVTFENQKGAPSGYLLNLSDITERKLAESALRHRLVMEEFLADLSKYIINIQPQQMNLEIEQAVARVGGFLKGNCSILYLYNFRSDFIRQSYCWHPGGTDLVKKPPEELPVESFAWIKSVLDRGEQIRIDLRFNLPESAQVELEVMKENGYESLLAAPLLVGSELAGALMIASQKKMAWSEEDNRFLRLTGDILLNAVVRTEADESVRQSARRLKCLRTIDQVILSSQSFKEIAVVAMRTMRQLIPYRQAAVLLIDKDNQMMEHVASIFDSGAEVEPVGDLIKINPNDMGKLKAGFTCFEDDLLALKKRLGIEEQLLGAGFVSYISTPLMVQGDFAGLLSVTADRPGVFTREHIEIINEIGYLLAIGIYNTHLVSNQEETLRREEQQNETTRLISSSFDIESILEEVLRRSVDLIHAEAGVFCVNQAHLSMTSNSCRSYHLTMPADILEAIPSDDYFEPVRQTGATLLCNDLGNMGFTSKFLIHAAQEGLNRVVVVPVQATGKVIGLLALFNQNGSRPFNQRDVNLLESLGMQAGIAIQNATSFQEEHNRVMELEALQNTVTDILTEHDLQKLLHSIVDRARRLLNAGGGELALYEEGKDYLEVVVCLGLEQDYSRTHIDIGEGGFGRIAASRQPIIVNDYHSWEGRLEKYVYAPSVSFVGVPLIAEDRLLGALGVGDTNRHRKFDEKDVRLLTMFGQQAAIAIEKTLLYDQAQSRAWEAETLRQASATVAASLNQEDTVLAILEQLGRVVTHDSASLMLLEGDAMVVVGGYGYGDKSNIIGLSFSIQEKTTASEVFSTKNTLIIPDVHRDPGYIHVPGEQVNSWMGIPLIIHGKVIGMLTLDSREQDHFTEEHARLGKAFADQVAIALENARLFDEVQQLAITDPLTGLFNRRYFMKLGALEFERAIRYHRLLSLVMLDIDYFKQVNDTYGHSLGDQMLVELAECCKAALRISDILCRFGGDEFVMLLPETGIESAAEIAERLRLKVVGTPFQAETGQPFSISISLGVVDIALSEPCSLDDFINRVDAALYRAKQDGRNRVCRWEKTMWMGLQHETAADS